MMNSKPNPYEDNELEIIAHLNPSEVKDLTELQGGHSADKDTNLPSFMPLLKKLSDPKIMPLFKDLLDNINANPDMLRRADGGSITQMNDHLSRSGRFGDTIPVKLPTVIANYMDAKLNNGNPSINPTTGKREYFLGGLMSGLKNMFSGVGNTLGGAVSSFLPSLGGIANQISNFAGSPEFGNALSGALSGAGQAAQNAMQGGNFNPEEFLKNAGSSAISSFAPMAGNAAQMALTGLGAEAGNPELGEMGGNFTNDLISNYLPQAAQSLASGQQAPSFGRAASNAGGRALSGYSNQNAATRGFGDMLNAYGSGASPQEAANQGIQTGINNMQNPGYQLAAQTAYNTGQNYQQGYSPSQSFQRGFGSVNPNMLNNAVNYGVSRIQNRGPYSAVDTRAPSYSQYPGYQGGIYHGQQGQQNQQANQYQSPQMQQLMAQQQNPNQNEQQYSQYQ